MKLPYMKPKVVGSMEWKDNTFYLIGTMNSFPAKIFNENVQPGQTRMSIYEIMRIVKGL